MLNFLREYLSGVTTTLAGFGSFSDGTGTSAIFGDPTGIAVDTLGILYVTDFLNNKIRKITSAGV